MGVAWQTLKNYDNAIEAYKNCLRLNPNHSNARYNYVLCKQMQKKQKQNGGKNGNDKKNKNDNKDKDKNKNKNGQNNNQNKNKNDNNQQQNNNQQQSGEMSKENAEQLLQAAMNEENQTEAKLKKAMQQPSNRNLDKNW